MQTPVSSIVPATILDFNFHITTPRLYISHIDPLSDEHVSFIMSIRHNSKFNKHNASARPLVADMEATRQNLVAGSERIARTGWGRYLVSLKPEKGDEIEVPFFEKALVPIGIVSMQQDRIAGVHGPSIPDVGFGFLGEFQGKGYATEASLGLMRWYQEEKGQDRFAAMTDPQNEQAQKLLRRLNFQCRGDRSVAGVVDEGSAICLSVWTLGVSDGEESLRQVGL